MSGVVTDGFITDSNNKYKDNMMRVLAPVLLVMMLAGLWGCDSTDQMEADGATVAVVKHQQNVFQRLFSRRHQGDLDELRSRGVLRLVAPRFDDAGGLPRDGRGTPALYRQQAEAFAYRKGLRPRWLYVDSVSELTEALIQGRADVIVTNFTVTQSRREDMAFSTPLQTVSEVLVIAADREVTQISEMPPFTLAVPANSSYAETAEVLQRRYEHITVEVVEGAFSDLAMVERVASGDVDATIVDDNTLRTILVSRTDVLAGPVVNPRRTIAWAVRKDSPQLLEALNNFITRERVAAATVLEERRDWQAIKESGVLRVLSSNNPASYFLWRGELMGFDYELISEFASLHQLRLIVTVHDQPSALFQALQAGKGDVVAASITDTPERREQGWVFSDRYLEITEQVVASADTAVLDTVQDLHRKQVVINPDTAYQSTLEELQAQGINVDIVHLEGATVEMLIDAVARGEYPFTIVDSHLAAMESTYRDDIHVVLDLGEPKQIAWLLRDDQPDLKAQLNRFIQRQYRGLFYNVVYNRYFREPRSITQLGDERVSAERALSPYDDLVRELAREKGFDWRLIIAQMYQESQFNPRARSFAGAQGLMQIMPRTAAQLGYRNMYDPEENILAGMTYMSWLEDRFPPSIPLDERLFFVLAAYNAGHGHVNDARQLAARLGKDPDRWFDNVEEAMLLLSRPQYFRQARHGYVRGREPVNYVRQIKQRYLGYVAMTETRQ